MDQLTAMGLSIVTEGAAAIALTRGMGPPAPPWARVAGAAAVGTLATHPLLWMAVPRLAGDLGYAGAVAVAEVCPAAVEAVFYRGLTGWGWRKAALVSVGANAASLSLGLALQALGAG